MYNITQPGNTVIHSKVHLVNFFSFIYFFQPQNYPTRNYRFRNGKSDLKDKHVKAELERIMYRRIEGHMEVRLDYRQTEVVDLKCQPGLYRLMRD